MSLTPRFLVLAAIVALCACAGVWLGPPWHQAWLVPGFLLVSLLLLEHQLTKRYVLTLQRHAPKQIELGRDLHVGYQLQSTPVRALSLELAEHMPRNLSGGDWQARYSLDTTGQASFTIKRMTQELGLASFFELHMRVLGVFGLSWWGRKLPAAASVRVVPQSLTQAERRQFTREHGEVSQSKTGQGLELITLRDYQPGDAPRSIDWKASARANASQGLGANGFAAQKMKVRVMSEDQNLELTVLMDVSQRSKLAIGAMRRLDHDVNLVSRLSQAALGAGDSMHFIAYADQIVHQLYGLRGDNGIRKLHTVLAGLSPEPSMPEPMRAASLVMQKIPRRTLLVCLTDVGNPHSNQLLVRALRLLGRKHLPLVACTNDPELYRLSQAQPDRQAADAWLAPSAVLSAEELLQESQRARETLASMGAVVVAADPERLDARVLSAYRDARKRRAV